ncbi:hypothetical protein M501DRAFT_375360 [Patellaria atrata CBS 101060]|uniref:Rhodopsin domain-containing protein n=1 Tax=Patellaria atrata CBS 101060 TaxID=1346257 RepID=A0A9P4SGK5_9PEZI|nr:hypothetical protein M501DRAFT_375360 [Patellaria atrata CBS 101060]
MASAENTIGPDHHSALVNIIIWIFFILSGLGVVSKVLTKFARPRRKIHPGNLQLDDILLTLALLLAAGQTVAVSQQVSAGLGKHQDTLKPASISKYEKTEYVAEILYIAVLCTTKSAAFLFALILQPTPTRSMLLKIIFGITIVWTIISIFGIAFQCDLPHPWEVVHGKCFNQNAFWIFVEVVNVSIDIMLAVLLISIVWILQTSNTKYILTLVFAARALILIPVIFKLVYGFRLGPDRDTSRWDITYKYANVAITTSVVMNTSILITCLPFMKPVMEYLQPGWSSSNVRRGLGYNSVGPTGGTHTSSNLFPLGTKSNPLSSKTDSSKSPSNLATSSADRSITQAPHVDRESPVV